MKNNEIWRDGEYEFTRSQISNELRDVRKQWREAYYSKIEKQKILIENHSKIVDLSKKCRKMYELITQYSKLSEKQRQELKLKDNDNVISQETIDKMEQEIANANERIREEERRYEEKVTEQARFIKNEEYELKVLQLKIKEKDKELRLNELKAKEYKRQIRHNSLKPMPKSTNHEFEALVSPRYEPFHGAKMRYQQ